MSLSSIRKKFFDKYPNSKAYITKNEKLDKYVCYVYDFNNQEKIGGVIDEQLKQKIVEYASDKGGDVFNAVLEYLTPLNLSDEVISKIGDCYFDYSTNKFKINSASEVCDMINQYASECVDNKNRTSKSKVDAYIIDENGNLDENSIFYMELCYKKTKSGQKVCLIDNTFTESEYRGAGIHSGAIKFLEAVLASKNIHNLIGESQECDVYDESGKSTLHDHYIKLGFSLTTTKDGRNLIVKQIDQFNDLPITKDDLIKE